MKPLCLVILLSLGSAHAVADDTPVALLRLNGEDTDPVKIDYAKLPTLKGTHTVINASDATLKFQLHNYLIHHDGRFWCLWSQGPPVEDEPSQHIRFATSDDGLKWSEAKVLVAPDDAEHGCIARGLWVREGELLALVAHFKGKGAFGVNKELELRAFAWDEASQSWKHKGKLFDNAINNFPPQPLPTGEWMMTRRDSRFNVSVLIGGRKSFDDWQSFPVVERTAVKGFSPDEPIWWSQPDGSLTALFRDNGGSNRLFHATSTDNGRTWSKPVLSNFPNSTSKIFSLRTSNGVRVLISNTNPSVGRRELHLSMSKDGATFTRMARLEIPSPKPATLQYPHAIEHDGRLLIAFSRNKTQTEVLQVSLDDIALP
ncbi:MAG: exo-alpha-sialidase [Planctomycetaceae bacterium]|nr:exo-alpha-sialidase [Planctomycetaceae bacterium]